MSRRRLGAIAIAIVLTCSLATPLAGLALADDHDGGETTVETVNVTETPTSTSLPTSTSTATVSPSPTPTSTATASVSPTSSATPAPTTASSTSTATAAPTATSTTAASTSTPTVDREPERTVTVGDGGDDRDRDSRDPEGRERRTIVSTATPESDGGQERERGDATATPAQGSAEVDENATSVVAEVDSQIRVTDYNYWDEKGTFYVDLEHRDPVGSRVQLTITEVIGSRAAGENSGSFGVAQVTLNPGEKITAEVDATRTDGTAAVMIVSQESLDNGTGTFLADNAGGPNMFSEDPGWGLVRLGAIGGAVGVVITALLVAWHHVADNSNKAVVKV